MKRANVLLLLALTLIVAVGVVGCAQPVPEPTEEAATEEPAAEGEVVELVYMRQAEGVEAELELVNQFNESHPNINVTVDSVPAEDNYPKLVLTTEAGNPPDIYMTYFTLGAATNGLALDLTPYIEKEGEEWFSSLSPNGWAFHEYAGKYYAVPWRVSPSVVILNTDLLEKAGLEVPTGEWTWEDFVAYAQAMTNPADEEYGFCLMGSAEDPGTDYQFYPFLFQAGGKMINDEGLSAFNDEAGAEALGFMVSLINEYAVTPPGTTSATANACIDLLAAGKVGMWTNADLWRGIIRSVYPDAHITVAPMPVHTSTGALIGGTGFGISPDSENPDAAWEFVKFMVSEDSMRYWTSAFDFTPPNISILEDPAFTEGNPEQLAVAYAMLNQKMYPLAHYPESSDLESVLRSYIQAAYLESMTPEEALAAAADEWDAVLTNYVADDWWAAWTE
jgi:multiple sugar transport system substrate-binding protein